MGQYIQRFKSDSPDILSIDDNIEDQFENSVHVNVSVLGGKLKIRLNS